MMRRAPLLLLCLLGGACTWFGGDSHVMVTSQPAGAWIFVDGEATERSTPAKLDFGALLGGDHLITLKRRGYAEESRWVLHYTRTSTSRWVDGADLRAVTNPLWWTLGDWFTPFAAEWEYVPHSLHVVLHPAGEAPVHAETFAGSR